MSIEELNPEQTTIPLKVFIATRFICKIVFYSFISLVMLSIIGYLIIKTLPLTFGIKL